MTFWQDAAPLGELADEVFEPRMDGTAFGATRRFPQDGAGLGLAQPVFYLIEVGDLPEDPADQARRLVFGFKFPPDMGMSPHEGDMLLSLGPRGIGAEAVALDDGGRRWMSEGWFAVGVIVRGSEQFGDTALVAAFAPVVEDTAAGDVGDPEAAGFGFAVAGYYQALIHDLGPKLDEAFRLCHLRIEPEGGSMQPDLVLLLQCHFKLGAKPHEHFKHCVANRFLARSDFAAVDREYQILLDEMEIFANTFNPPVIVLPGSAMAYSETFRIWAGEVDSQWHLHRDRSECDVSPEPAFPTSADSAKKGLSTNPAKEASRTRADPTFGRTQEE
jgi:hypothetical protein